MKINEVLTKNKNKLFVQQHIQWVADQLDIKKLPKIILLDQPKDTTFGQYVPDEHTIYLVIGGRHPIDVLRTLSHELTHHKQNIEDNLPSGAGETGTDQENEANANAGIVMRDFAGANPEYFGLKENFADGKVKGKSRPGRVKRAGASCKGSVTDLRAKAKKASGERKSMYHWCANMKSGKKK